jgi:hypothetical protein
MPKIAYRDIKFNKSSLDIIQKANTIIADYSAQGYSLTLRQLYYQFVSKNWIANKDTEYKRLGDIIANGRYAGRIDWRAIEDRTRNLTGLPTWDSPTEIIESAAEGYREQKWEGQTYRPEIWVEKEALAGIVAQAANAVEVNYMACRGYMSASEMWEAARRFMRYRNNGQIPVIFHLGDHDPSGVHMSEDIGNRIREFMHSHGIDTIKFERLALNMDQVEQYNPPPNPAKLTDSRCVGYVEQYGHESWELDALPPQVLDQLMQDAVKNLRDEDKWNEAVEEQERQRSVLTWVSENWADVTRQAINALDGDYDNFEDPDDL